jgi:hypothetical protein
LSQNHGQQLLEYHGNSPSKALVTLYPDVEWEIWRFDRVSRNFWKKAQNRRKYFEWLGQQMKYEGYEGWYDISKEVLIANGGYGIIEYYGESPIRHDGSFFFSFLPI